MKFKDSLLARLNALKDDSETVLLEMRGSVVVGRDRNRTPLDSTVQEKVCDGLSRAIEEVTCLDEVPAVDPIVPPDYQHCSATVLAPRGLHR